MPRVDNGHPVDERGLQVDGRGVGSRRARQAAEQYFTSSQCFAHFLRHVIGRPQATHGLLGKRSLFPLKADVVMNADEFPE